MKKTIKKLIDESNSIILFTHIRPDGDAVGSVLSFYNYLKSLNKDVEMIIEEAPEIFNFLPGFEKINKINNTNYDLGIIVDCATLDRVGQLDNKLSCCLTTLNIDHHVSNSNYASINYVKGEVSSCCQVIYELFKDMNVLLDKNISSALATGMITDTNGFRNNNVTNNTFLMASDLLNYDIEFHKIYEHVLFNKSYAKHNLMKIALERLEFLCDGKVAFTYILKDDFDKLGAVIGDHEGIVDIGRSIDGVEVSIFIRENDGFTISLRSTGKIDVNEIASTFGGGGHTMAAGGQIYKTLQETKDTVINATKKVLYDNEWFFNN